MFQSLSEIAALLNAGEIAAIPTETVYGLAAQALNPHAVEKIFRAKGRPSDNPLIVHVADVGMAESLVTSISPDARRLMEAFWPGPLTVILPKAGLVPDIVTASLPNIALRIPNHDTAIALIKETGPLAAPSANKSGKPSPTSAFHVEQDFGPSLPVLDAGPCDVGIESTVVGFIENTPVIFRPGSISATMISGILGKTVMNAQPFAGTGLPPQSPGMKYTHYSPLARVCWWDGQKPGKDDMLITISSGMKSGNLFSFDGDFEAFARSLYDSFRQADFLQKKRVLIEPFQPDAHSIAPALLNRINKAAGLDS